MCTACIFLKVFPFFTNAYVVKHGRVSAGLAAASIHSASSAVSAEISMGSSAGFVATYQRVCLVYLYSALSAQHTRLSGRTIVVF